MEIETLDALDAALARDSPLGGLRLQGLDLRRPCRRPPAPHRPRGAGGARRAADPRARRTTCEPRRALIFPTDPHAPVDPYRATLYPPQELYAGLATTATPATPDARAYRWSRDAATRSDAFVTLLRAIHDDSITDALDEFVAGRPVVGVMGGHALERGTRPYADAAHLGRDARPGRARRRDRRRARRDGGGQPGRPAPRRRPASRGPGAAGRGAVVPARRHGRGPRWRWRCATI